MDENLILVLLERLTEEHEKKIKEIETNWQMQVTSTRTTLELVKEQMERDAEDKLQALDQHHRSQLGELDIAFANIAIVPRASVQKSLPSSQ